ncbi:helix-turn-helix domain-containing protein [Frigoribacterium sp. PhB116]|uniref:helix-turn-helix domain-containing protein n=1 Tax=Frigoribacterium sp. PhB116 TaxID=2485174 RepID=UPI00105B9C6D|nr:helix-turn-helix domain-containing protein [Frigoribacterium sp. PhB116]TDT65779.1 GAF domain-containing protein [Frigoribacterium sp. PhB116]
MAAARPDPPTARASRGAARRLLLAASWKRAADHRVDPDALPLLELPDDDLASWRREHPLALLLPVVQRLLIDDVEGSGLLVAVGDERGRLLWVEGDREARRRAESMLFVAGAGWAESRVGTSAPGTALELDRGVQVRGPEHFSHLVQEWSCTAVPVHDPADGRLIGVVDITGDDRAAGEQTLPLLRATVAAMEAELALSRTRSPRRVGTGAGAAPGAASSPRTGSRPARRPRAHQTGPATPAPPRLDVLGRDEAVLHAGWTATTLSARHSELLLLLAARPEGWSAEALADAIWGERGAVGTLRPELVRLRHVLEAVAPSLVPTSRPYRLPTGLATDADEVVHLLDRGAHRAALRAATGPLLPGSSAPGVESLRAELARHLGESLRTSGSVDVLLQWVATAQGADDEPARRELLRLLPPRSPRRAGLVAGAVGGTAADRDAQRDATSADLP